jgi:AcrR family transcriptional regulator
MPRRRDSTADRTRVLEAAERVFAERGFRDARMQDVAAEASVSLRTVYAAAAGKDTLYRALNDRRARDLLNRIESVLGDDAQNPVECLMEVISVVATLLMDHPDFLRIQLQEGGTWALDEPDRTLLVSERHSSDRLLERLFRRGIRMGAFYDEGSRSMVATLRALEQVQLAAWADRRGRLSRKATIERIQWQARRLFCPDEPA